MSKSAKPRTATCKFALQVQQEVARKLRRTKAKKGGLDAS